MALVLDGTNGVSGVDGTASNPSLEGTDSNTGVFFPAADTVAIGTGGTERLRVDSAGNAGLGVTPNTWFSGYKVIETGSGSLVFPASATNTQLWNNLYVNAAGNVTYKATGIGGLYSLGAGGNAHVWYSAPSGTAGTTATLTQAMTLDASGILLVGTTSASASLAAGGLQVTDRICVGTGSVGTPSLHASGDTNTGLYFPGADIVGFATGGTERARITSGGVLLVGTTSDANLPGSGTSNATGIAIGGNQIRACRDQYTFQIGVTNTGAGVLLQQFFQAGTNCGQITVSNSNATAYQTSSDYRLKDNPQPMTGALEKVAALNPCTWTWKNTGDAGQGFIAHEVQQYFPDAVSGEKDGVDENGNPVYQGIDTSFLVATLTAAIQELNAKVEVLEAQLKGNA